MNEAAQEVLQEASSGFNHLASGERATCQVWVLSQISKRRSGRRCRICCSDKKRGMCSRKLDKKLQCAKLRLLDQCKRSLSGESNDMPSVSEFRIVLVKNTVSRN